MSEKYVLYNWNRQCARQQYAGLDILYESVMNASSCFLPLKKIWLDSEKKGLHSFESERTFDYRE
jgi:hypothetical protein